MKTIVSVFAAISSVALTCFMIETATGQSNQYVVARASGNGGSAQSSTYRSPQANQISSSAKIVGYRATEWKTVPTASSEEATETAATLKRIGCEVDTSEHGDHIDIKFRCPEWHSMKVKTHTLQSQWSTWCETQGMEIVVVNPLKNTLRPTVTYQMPRARTVHLHDREAAQKILNTLTLIGCEIKTASHDGHTDATFSCPEWRTIELASDDTALAWQKWLDESGFETKIAHVAVNEGSADGNEGSATRDSGSGTH